ncbi:MAG: hypothetical protein ACO3FQ_08635 [Terrimicrobiaceae bacterium]
MEKYTYTQNIKAAAALTTLGFRHKESSPCVRVHREDGKETSSFWFEEHGPNGLRASKVIYWMTKGHAELEESDPEHPVNYIRAGFVNRETWIDVHKSTPRVLELKRNGKILYLSENADEETRRKFSKLF